jgi:hypothetical protein
MRADTAARSIVFVLKIGPLLLIEVMYLALILTADLIDAEQYLSGARAGLVDWPALGQPAMVLRASALIACSSLFAVAFMHVGGDRLANVRRPVFVVPAMILWVVLLLV